MTEKLSFYERTGFHSFDEVYRIYQERMERYVLKNIQNYSDVEDIVQQTFLAFFKQQDDFVSRHENGVESYLYGTASKRIIDYYRRKTVRRRTEKKLKEGHAVSQFSRGEVTYINENTYTSEKEELTQKIKTILSEGEWQVFLLRTFESCRYQEISNRLGISVNNARQRQLRARKKLRFEMKEYNFDNS